MNGYLMQELAFHAGDESFVESFAAEGRFGVVFEDDGETGYFYAVEKDAEGNGMKVLDALHIYEAVDDEDEEEEGEGGAGDESGESDDQSEEGIAADEDDETDPAAANPGQTDPAAAETTGEDGPASNLQIVWSKDWKKCALVIDGYCQAVFDFEAQEGYNINEFPPANQIWSKGERTLTDEIVQKLF